MARGRRKGGQKTGGRKTGTPNKSTVAVKEALGGAFDGIGGVQALTEWARQNPTDFYKLWAKMLPLEVRNPDGETFRVGVVEEIVSADEGDT